jgi:hypothetical protein
MKVKVELAWKPAAMVCRPWGGVSLEGLKFYWRAARNYYTMPFMELSRRPCDHHDLSPANLCLGRRRWQQVSCIIFASVKAMESEVQKARSNV